MEDDREMGMAMGRMVARLREEAGVEGEERAMICQDPHAKSSGQTSVDRIFDPATRSHLPPRWVIHSASRGRVDQMRPGISCIW
jgi:hypothetical protein